jgi:hypothetical protein
MSINLVSEDDYQQTVYDGAHHLGWVSSISARYGCSVGMAVITDQTLSKRTVRDSDLVLVNPTQRRVIYAEIK